MKPLAHMGRRELEAYCVTMLDNLTATQKRCTELLEENRKLKMSATTAKVQNE